MEKIKVGVFFGGKSVEHEISIISMIEATLRLNEEKYEAEENSSATARRDAHLFHVWVRRGPRRRTIGFRAILLRFRG